jgi:hypothetical protein
MTLKGSIYHNAYDAVLHRIWQTGGNSVFKYTHTYIYNHVYNSIYTPTQGSAYKAIYVHVKDYDA